MNLYIKQKVFSFGDKFTVYDYNGNAVYTVQGEVFTFGKKLHIYDTQGKEVAYVHQKLLSFLPKYYISMNGRDVAEVVKEFTFFRQEYTVSPLNWKVNGDFWEHRYTISDGTNTVAKISKEWLSWGDTYEINVSNGYNEIMALATCLIIDACIETQDNN